MMDRSLLFVVFVCLLACLATSASLTNAEGDVVEGELSRLVSRRRLFRSATSGSNGLNQSERNFIKRLLRQLESSPTPSGAPPSSPSPSSPPPPPSSPSPRTRPPRSSRSPRPTPGTTYMTTGSGVTTTGADNQGSPYDPVFHGLLSSIMAEYGPDVSQEDFLWFMAEAMCILSAMIGKRRQEQGGTGTTVAMGSNPLTEEDSLETRFLESFCEAVASDMDSGLQVLVEALENFSALNGAK